jgi:hypothetical protein
MLFHVTAEHDHMTCPGREGGIGSDAVRESQKWMEGNADVNVLGVWDISLLINHGPSLRQVTLLR